MPRSLYEEESDALERVAEQDTYKVTESMKGNAQRGLDYRKKNGGKGGTAVGIGMARKILRGTLKQEDVNNMRSKDLDV